MIYWDYGPKKESDRPFHDSRSPPNACYKHLPLSYDRRGRGRSLSLAEERAAVLRTASNRQR